MRSLNIHYIVVDYQALHLYPVVNGHALPPTKETIEEWAHRYGAEMLGEVTFDVVWGSPPGHLYLARLLPAPVN